LHVNAGGSEKGGGDFTGSETWGTAIPGEAELLRPAKGKKDNGEVCQSDRVSAWGSKRVKKSGKSTGKHHEKMKEKKLKKRLRTVSCVHRGPKA